MSASDLVLCCDVHGHSKLFLCCFTGTVVTQSCYLMQRLRSIAQKTLYK